jgi:UDP-GlcNAc:undecaprenyl-phosphate GlcNAc-1-phosphate transferase
MLALSRLQGSALVLVATAGGAALLTPLLARAAVRLGLVDRPAPHKFHDAATPYLGGLSVAVPVLFVLLSALLMERSVFAQLATICLGAIGVASVGLVDDWRTIGPWPRLAVQAVAAVGLWTSGIQVNATGITLLDLPLTVLAVLTVTNAVNILDNMDGLAAGVVGIGSAFLFVAAFWQGQHLVSLMAIALAGASVGFLHYNFSPARIFLGDAGTLFMGFLLSATLLKLNLAGYPLVTRSLVPVLLVAVPLFDMVLVVGSRWRAGRPVFRGGIDHSSHRLVALGASPRATALYTYAGATAACATALALLRTHGSAAGWVVLALYVVAGASLLLALERVDYRTARPRHPLPGVGGPAVPLMPPTGSA